MRVGFAPRAPRDQYCERALPLAHPCSRTLGSRSASGLCPSRSPLGRSTPPNPLQGMLAAGIYHGHMPPLCYVMISSPFGLAQREHALKMLHLVLAALPEGYQGNRQGSSGREREGEAPRKESSEAAGGSAKSGARGRSASQTSRAAAPRAARSCTLPQSASSCNSQRSSPCTEAT
jgi:hypothetical protein